VPVRSVYRVACDLTFPEGFGDEEDRAAYAAQADLASWFQPGPASILGRASHSAEEAAVFLALLQGGYLGADAQGVGLELAVVERPLF
jgi:hypothetical protein